MDQSFLLTTFLIVALLLLVHVSLWALAAIRKKRADMADTAWGLGFLLAAWVSFVLSPFSYQSLLVNLMVTAWSLRLSWHIHRRNRNRKEDFRYENLKKSWGDNTALRLFFQVFLLQGAILYIVALPILWINTHPGTIGNNLLLIGFAVWLFGFLIETVADYQLNRFQQGPSNRGKLLTSGLWGTVRHPNYLGELIQWWAFWALSANPVLLISPLLITFLIVKISGIAPLEKKMQTHPDFEKYAATTPSLVPFSLINGTIYTLAWVALVYFGPRSSFLIPLALFLIVYGLQLFLFSKYDRKSLQLSPILSFYALFFGTLQETIFIHAHLLEYPQQNTLPPLYLLCLYPLFALTLNSSLRFINKNLPFAFLLGGLGALLSYVSAQKLGAVQFLSPLAYPIAFLFWGIYLTVLVLLNRKLIRLRDKYTDPVRSENTLTVFFDENCPVCSTEMKTLKKRKQTGKIIYDCLQSQESFEKRVPRIAYKKALQTIHAIDANGEIFTGIDALSELYARTDLPWLALLMQAPGFRPFFILCYAIWAKLRKHLQ